MVRNSVYARVGLAWALMAAAGCADYRPQPLDPEQILQSVERQRRDPDGTSGEGPSETPAEDGGANAPPDPPAEPLTLARATEWLQRHGPGVREAVAEYRTALALARVKTPLPNPGIEFGPQVAVTPGMGPWRHVAPFGSIGFAIPLGGRLRRQDELNRAQAEVARVEALARLREEYLDLREQYTDLVVARARVAACRSLAEGAKQTFEAGKRLVQAGQTSAVDVALLELEQVRAEEATLSAEREALAAESALAELLGVHHVHIRKLPEPALPQRPVAAPSPDLLRQRMVFEHPELGRWRARYEAAERALRLEVARQYPDLRIGPSFDKEAGEKKLVLGLTLGIDLPVFDRNQQAIAEARKRREEIRAKYEAAMNRALGRLDQALRALELAAASRRLHEEKILPLARTNVALARRSLEAGAADALRMLDAERSERELRLEALAADLAERRAWMDLEQAVGVPLVAFPSEPEAAAPPPPEPLDEAAGTPSKSREEDDARDDGR